MEVSTTVLSDRNGSTVCENELIVGLPSLGNRQMKFALLHNENDIEPIFSGAAWAGSVLWAAAQVLVEELLLNSAVAVRGKSIIELGCGLGIPGCVASLLGAREAVLTEQPTLLALLRQNVTRNFPAAAEGTVEGLRSEVEIYKRSLESVKKQKWGAMQNASHLRSVQAEEGRLVQLIVDIEGRIQSMGDEHSASGGGACAAGACAACADAGGGGGGAAAAAPKPVELSWGTEETERFLATHRRVGGLFDLILVCDCVFAPLYGDSWRLLCDTLRVLCPYGSAAKTAALIACERRCDDGIDDFLANLGRDFDLAVEWNSYADAELEALLATSHIGAARKPLRIYRATRVGAAGIAGSVGAASDVPVRDYSETLKRACAAEWREDDDPGDDREKAGEVPASLEAGGGHGRADDSDSGDDGGDDQHPLPEEVVLPPAPRGEGEATEGHRDPPLLVLSRTGDSAGVVKLLASGLVDPDEPLPSCTALYWAARLGHSAVVDALLDAGADVDAPSSTYEEKEEKQQQEQQQHEEWPPPPPPPLAAVAAATGVTPLMAASAAGHVAVVAQLAAWGANAEARDSVGRLPLDVAPEAHRAAMEKALGADYK